jgi:hypothetical protein
MEPVLPAGWLRAFLDRADLDQSYAELEGCAHFHARTMQGRIRSLQLRFEDARTSFERGLAAAGAAPVSIASQVRRLILHVYRFENSLLEAPLPAHAPPPTLELSSVPPELHREYPELKLAINLRTCAEGLYRLHLGDWKAAAALYSRLIEAGREEPRSVLSAYYLGLAASRLNLGQVDAARRSFEDCGLCVALDCPTLTRLSMGSALVSAYTSLEDDETADTWRAFLERLDCPAATRDAFLRRAALLVNRWQTQGRLVVW